MAPGTSVCVLSDTSQYCNWVVGSAGFWSSGQLLTVNDCNSTWMWKPTANTSFPITFFDWASPVEPNCGDDVTKDGGHESCIMYWQGENYQWNDMDCATPWCPICQIDIFKS